MFSDSERANWLCSCQHLYLSSAVSSFFVEPSVPSVEMIEDECPEVVWEIHGLVYWVEIEIRALSFRSSC